MQQLAFEFEKLQIQKQKDKNSLENLTSHVFKARNNTLVTQKSLDLSIFTNIKMAVITKENRRLEYLNSKVHEKLATKEQEITTMAKNMWQEPNKGVSWELVKQKLSPKALEVRLTMDQFVYENFDLEA